MAVGTVRKRKTLAAIATGTALMIVAQLATVFSMTVLSALGEHRPVVVLVACVGRVAVAGQPGVIASVWFRTATSSSYVGSLPVDIIVIYNLIFIYEYNSNRQFHYLLSC